MKQKLSILFMIGAVVAAILIAGAALLLVTSLRAKGDTRNQFTRKKAELDGFYRRDPFPASENVTREQRNAESIDSWHRELNGIAADGQVELDERRPAAFMALLGQTQRQLLASGKAPQRVAADFAFGFDPYFGPDSLLPSPDNVPRLTRQLRIVEAVCQVLFEEGITRIRAIEREVFEAGVAPTARGAREQGMMNPRAGLMGDDDLYSRFHFRLTTEAREAALLAILNRLARLDQFVVVTGVDCKKQGDDVKTTERRPAAAAPDAPPSPLALALGARRDASPPLIEEPLRREQRLVSGLALEVPMVVIIDLDVYQFRTIPATAARADAEVKE